MLENNRKQDNNTTKNNQQVVNLKYLKITLAILIISEVLKRGITPNLIMDRLNLTRVVMQLLKLHS